MKTILFVILTLSSAHTRAADWLHYHTSPDGQVSHYYDWDSLSQTPDGFEADIRVLSSPDRRELTAHLNVDCRADAWQLSKTNPGEDANPIREDILPVDGTTIVSLRQTFCVHKREPDGALWRELGTTHQGTILYNERLEPTPTGFATHIRVLGGRESYLFEIRINCAENRYAIANYVARDERSGLLVNKAPAGPLPIEPGTMPDLLKASNCPAGAKTEAGR